VFEGSSVYELRERLGFNIAVHYRPEVDFVVPVPESGVPVGYGYSQATGVPIRMGIVRDRYESGRSFMQDNQLKREDTVNKKLNIIPAILEGKAVLLTEDSLVRGTTMKNLIEELRAAGATEVHVAFSCPPIISGCRYGIDFYDKDLTARPFRDVSRPEINREIAKRIGANSAYYQTIDGLVEALRVSRENLCLSCLTGIYVQPGSLMSEEERKK
jgi:amidophosphoribosyltransferase